MVNRELGIVNLKDLSSSSTNDCMINPLKYTLHSQTFWLSPERCAYWEEQKALVVSDLHFGKTGHFRKSGIPVPPKVYKEDLQRLVQQIQFFHPDELIVVGDLFHSRENKELELFLKWRNDFPYLRIKLVKGNHDILNGDWYEQAGIEVYEEFLTVDQFTFIHDVTACEVSDQYFFTGHIHPGISISGMGRQSLSFPCFYFGKNYAVLPAFSRFTGLALISPDRNEDVFAIIPANQSRGQMESLIKI
jgi:DNA ligase-associated metallophosphoesterase